MGAGKSTLGREAAERIDRSFVDVDELVEAEYGGTVAELFARDGEERFREVEEEWAVSMLESGPGGVIALGGGAIESERIRQRLREVATDGLARRARRRGVAARAGHAAPARAGRSGVPLPLRAPPAALRSGGRFRRT